MELFDAIQIVMWSITYVFVIIFGFKRKSYFMPVLAAFLNLSWEANAFSKDIINNNYTTVTLAHFIWLFLDFFIILTIAFYYIENNKKGLLCFIALPIFIFIFNLLFEIDKGQLRSSFTIDLIMALCYLFAALKTRRNYSEWLLIGVTKLIGDFFAFVMYRKDEFVYIIGMIVFVINFVYLLVITNKKSPKIFALLFSKILS